MLRLRGCGTALLGILATVVLQGCILTRVLDTRAQLCDEQPSRVIVTAKPGNGLRVIFEKPTLTDRDIVWIVGSEPTGIRSTDKMRELTYEALPLHRPHDRAAGLVSRLSFVHMGGEYWLAEVEIPEKFNAILPPPLLDAAVRIVCKAKIVIVPPSTTFDLAALDRAALPTRNALGQLLGTPVAVVARSNEILYQYCLAPCAADAALVASLHFSFGGHGDLQRAEARYFRYRAVVDLMSSTPTATIELH